MHCEKTISLESTLNSGQSFLWERKGRSWYGIHGDTILKITVKETNEGTVLEYDSFPQRKNWQKSYFRLNDGYNEILTEISTKDLVISPIIKKHFGLRILRQHTFQCIISFLCSSNNNIPRIRRILINLSKKFGTKTQWENIEFYTFPTIESLHNASLTDLLSCGLGYRAKFVIGAVKKLADKTVDMNMIKKKEYHQAKEEILKLNGVGEKIADCILLFSLDKLEAFPIDVWVTKFINKNLSQLLTEDYKLSEKITLNQYKFLSEKIRSHYGRYAGYAQQYIYYYIREENGKKW